jgi:NADP-dependent 3-hydroxy acid dehydrogenase YdfG
MGMYMRIQSSFDALTKGMRIDLLQKGYKVTAIHPGMVETEFSIVRFKGNAEKASKVYDVFDALKAKILLKLLNSYYTATPR